MRRFFRPVIFSTLILSSAGCFGDGEPSTRPNESPITEQNAISGRDWLAPSLDGIRAAGDSVRLVLPDSLSDSLTVSEVDRLSAAISELASSIQTYNSLQEGEAAQRDVTLGQMGGSVQNYSVRIFWTLLILIATYFFVRGITFVLDKVSEINTGRRLFYKRLVPILRVLVWSTSLYFVVRVVFEVNTQNLLAAAAAVGVAIGFAAQDIVKNIFGGFVIISDRPFQVGDKIQIDGTYGEVTSIGLRSTRIVTPDDSVVSVPNAQVISSQVSNANAGALDCQVVTDLYLPGWVDEAKAKGIAYEAAATSKYVYLKKPIVVLVKDEFRETFITHIKVKAYVMDTRYEFLLMSDITEKARRSFREAGLMRDVYNARAFVDFSSLPFGPQNQSGAGTEPRREDDRPFNE